MRSIGNYLQSRLFIGLTIIVAFGSIILAIAMRALDLREFDAALETKARTLSTLIFQHPGAIEVDFADEFLPEFEQDKDKEYFLVRLFDGTVIEGSKDLDVSLLPLIADRLEKPGFQNLTLPDGRRGRFVQIAVQPRTDTRALDEDEVDLFPLPDGIDTSRPYVLLTVAWGRQQLDTILWTIYAILLGMMLLLILLLTLLVRRFLRLGFKPIEEMNDQIRGLGPKTLDRRIMLHDPPAELEPALSTLNGFLDDLQKAFSRERRFTSNVAHELRTPVAEFRLACEIGAKWPDDPAMVRQRFDELRESALLMERKVKGLLDLSRLDNHAVPVTLTEIRLHPFIGTRWQQTRDAYNPHRISLVNEIENSRIIRSDEVKLDMILQNLFFNAMSYSVPDSTVTISSRAANEGGYIVSISNHTVQLESDDIERLFDRFWRKQPGESGGHRLGLGLSIVHSLAELLGIQVGADLSRTGIFVIHLTFPPHSVVSH